MRSIYNSMIRDPETNSARKNERSGNMRQWVCWDDGELVSAGEYTRSHVSTLSGMPLHLEKAFLIHLAEIFMQRYESREIKFPLVISDSDEVNRKRTKHFYRRLFCQTEDGMGITQEFITHASESLTWWLEMSHESVLFADGGKPHNSDPAYDTLTILDDGEGNVRLRVVQAKATRANTSQNASEAIAKFADLELGLYDADLSSSLELIQQRGVIPGIDVGELLFDVANRRYRIVIVHGREDNDFHVLGGFANRISGPVERRSAVLVKIDFDLLWSSLGEIIYDKLV